MYKGRVEAEIPKPFRIGDEVVIKGKITNDNRRFIRATFKVDDNNMPYIFKTIFNTNIVQQGYKRDGKWHKTKGVNTWTDGLGSEFVLTFHFDEKEILVYDGDEHRRLKYKFEYQFDINVIKSLSLGMGHVREIKLRYAKAK